MFCWFLSIAFLGLLLGQKIRSNERRRREKMVSELCLLQLLQHLFQDKSPDFFFHPLVVREWEGIEFTPSLPLAFVNREWGTDESKERGRSMKRYADDSVDCQGKRWTQRTSCLPFFATERSKFYTERNQENVTSQIKFRERWVLFPVRSKLRMQSSLPSTDSLPALFPLNFILELKLYWKRESFGWRIRFELKDCVKTTQLNCLSHSWFSKSLRRSINAHVTQSSL